MKIKPTHRGLAYGDGHMQGDGEEGQVVRIVGNNLFAVNTDPAQPSFGILVKSAKAGQMPGIYCQGGTYETEVFEGTIAAGDALKVSAAGKLTNGVGASDEVIARAIAMENGTLTFALLI